MYDYLSGRGHNHPSIDLLNATIQDTNRINPLLCEIATNVSMQMFWKRTKWDNDNERFRIELVTISIANKFWYCELQETERGGGGREWHINNLISLAFILRVIIWNCEQMSHASRRKFFWKQITTKIKPTQKNRNEMKRNEQTNRRKIVILALRWCHAFKRFRS